MKIFVSLFVPAFMLMGNKTCNMTQKLQQEPPVTISEVYVQTWIAGVQGGGAGTNLYILLKQEIPEGISLDSVYFRNKATKLERKPNEPKLYIGRFLSDLNRHQDLIMDGDPRQEYGNEPPIRPTKKYQFDLTDKECIVSYLHHKDTKYFKLTGITEKASIPYPSAPPIPNQN